MKIINIKFIKSFLSIVHSYLPNCKSFLSKPKGHVSILIVGGALEALEGHRKEIRLVLNRRKGFIKLALRFGVDLVPTFSFGEQFIYEQADNAKGYLVIM